VLFEVAVDGDSQAALLRGLGRIILTHRQHEFEKGK